MCIHENTLIEESLYENSLAQSHHKLQPAHSLGWVILRLQHMLLQTFMVHCNAWNECMNEQTNELMKEWSQVPQYTVWLE